MINVNKLLINNPKRLERIILKPSMEDIQHHIISPLLKSQKIIQVDYLTSELIQRNRDYFQQPYRSTSISRQKQKLLNYFQREHVHNEKYYNFKKMLNQKYFNQHLPSKYMNSVMEETLEQADSLYLTRKVFNKITDSLGPQMDDSTNTNTELLNSLDMPPTNKFKGSFKHWETITNCPPRKNLSSDKNKRPFNKASGRYSPELTDLSFIFKDSQTPQLKSRKKMKLSQPMDLRTKVKGVLNSIQTSRPLSQLQTRQTQTLDIMKRQLKSQRNSKNSRNYMTSMSGRNKIKEKNAKQQRKSILDKIENKDELMRFLRQSTSVDPKKKGIYTIEDLSAFEKYNLPFLKYLKLKSLKKIDKYAHEKLVREKCNNLQKFQSFILQEFPIESDNKRKLQKVFSQIIWEFERTQRRKEAEKR